MSITYANAYAYVARALARAIDTDRTATAQDAIAAAIGEWNLRRDWNFMRMDTRNGFTVAACANTAGAVTTSTTDGFAGVNIGQTFTVTDGAPAGTYTVTAVSSTTTITASGGGGNFTGESLTFSGDIPITAGTDVYNFPSNIKRAYTVRLLGNQRPLVFRDQRWIDRMYFNQNAQQTVPFYYNTFNDASFVTGKSYGKLRLFPVPGVSDTARVKYFRDIAVPTADADILEVPNRMIYALLTLARYYFLANFDAETPRLGEMKERAEFLFKQAQRDDRITTYDNDLVASPFIEWGTFVHPFYDDTSVY